jgi:hypothetical protein
MTIYQSSRDSLNIIAVDVLPVRMRRSSPAARRSAYKATWRSIRLRRSSHIVTLIERPAIPALSEHSLTAIWCGASSERLYTTPAYRSSCPTPRHHLPPAARRRAACCPRPHRLLPEVAQLLRRLQFLVGKVYAKVQKECNDHNSKLARDLASGKISEDDADKTMSWMDTFATRMAISEDEAYKLLRGQHIEHMIKKQKRQARRLLADLERVYGVTEVREANAQKVALLHSPEQRAREFERRKAHRQSIRDNNLSQIVGTFEREVADLFTFKCGDEPFKGFVSRMISLATFFLALWFFSNKDVQAAARKVMTIPERKADGVLVQFEKSLFDRLTNGVERRREQGRKRIARHRAADKANEPIHTIVDSPLVE